MVESLLSATSWFAGALVAYTALVFGRSLLPGRKPLVACFAEGEDPSTAHRPDLQPYLRRLTVIWTGLLGVCSMMLLSRSALATEAELQAVNSVAPALLIGTLFLGERWLRARRFGGETVGSLATQYRTAARILRSQWMTFGKSEPSDMLGMPVFADDDARVLIAGGRRPCTTDDMQRAALRLAPRLPNGQRIGVLCDDRTLFIAAVLACWSAHRTIVLPPSNNSDHDEAGWQERVDGVVTDDTAITDEAAVRWTLDDFWLAVDAKDRFDVAINLPGAHEAVIFHTSGSTGRPQAHTKMWSELAGAANAMSSLLRARNAPMLGGTVSPAHMFGFEMLVMQPLRGGATLYAPRIAYPSDLHAFAAFGAGDRWLVTTPFHLQLFLRADVPATGITRVVSATMPLDASLADEFEARSGAEVGEIYGSTESGCLGFRRTARDTEFTPAPGVSVKVVAPDRARFTAPYLRHPVDLRDRLEVLDRGFNLLGRDVDTVKVAGKRASLAALTQTLRSLSGIEDACYFDATRNGHTRLAAFVVAPGIARESIREALAGRVDAAFMPRPLLVVDSLPRDANGKLQHQVLERLVAEAQPRLAVGCADN